jgi:methyl coenzyme M reductase subunit D
VDLVNAVTSVDLVTRALVRGGDTPDLVIFGDAWKKISFPTTSSSPRSCWSLGRFFHSFQYDIAAFAVTSVDLVTRALVRGGDTPDLVIFGDDEPVSFSGLLEI